MVNANVNGDMTTDAPLPPYISYPTLITLLDWLKEMPAIPSQIDRSLWASKFAGSTGPQVMVALRFLKLLAGNKPQPLLEELAKAPKARRQELMVQLLRDAYGLSGVDEVAKMTPAMLDDRLGKLGTTSSTHRKALSFFVNACKSNGIAVPPNISKKARIRGSKPKAPPRPASPPRPLTPTPPSEIIPPRGGTAPAQESLLLWGLFSRLPKPGTVWPEPERNKWLEATKLLFAMEYKES